VIPVRLTKSEVESIHGLDERIPIAELEAGVNVFYIFLKKMIYAPAE
jgi:acetylornithine deacetylase/succinyl-diaminopimelate desuccinylase-like protein